MSRSPLAHLLPRTGPSAATGERRFRVDNVTWDQYAALRRLLDEVPGLRITYLEGMLELMSPSEEHERVKKTTARLVEAYAEEMDLPLNGFGSATYRKKARHRGLEPDECYVLGPKKKRVPDLAIEVVLTSGGIDRLDVYRGLGVPEVWFWRGGKFSVHHLGPRGYETVRSSLVLPGLDFALLARFVRRADQTAAVKAFRQALHRR